MICVTHDQIVTMTLGQRIVVLKDGEIQQMGTPMTLYARTFPSWTSASPAFR
jgi:multiple sugar transport system ATP-binding protein